MDSPDWDLAEVPAEKALEIVRTVVKEDGLLYHNIEGKTIEINRGESGFEVINL
ncbi:hypothetical protein JW710_01475 [Candidatus Dojkabacteria bacterium]|nr:hypothetical protein [Candidatus Dojkabacteria bacterium]